MHGRDFVIVQTRSPLKMQNQQFVLCKYGNNVAKRTNRCFNQISDVQAAKLMNNACMFPSLHIKTNFIYLRTGYNFERRQRLKYFGHVTRHNGLETTIMQGMVAGKRSRGKPRQRWENDITDTFGTMATASRVAEDRHQIRKHIWAASPEENMLWEERLYCTIYTCYALCVRMLFKCG